MILKHFDRLLKSESLKRKILITLWIVAIYKAFATLPVPMVNVDALVQLQNYLAQNSGLAFFSWLMGWWMSQFSIVLMGLSPYINAVIIIQLLSVVIPRLEEIKKEWSEWQKKINKLTRLITLPIALLQSYWMIFLLNNLVQGPELINTADFIGTILPAMIIISTGTMFLMWLGELISESGLWNWISIIIFAWVLAWVPSVVSWYLSVWNYTTLAMLTAATVAVIYIIIKFTEWYRQVPLIYTRTWRQEKSTFPIRVNQAWMIPIIFAVSLITFPWIIGQLLVAKWTGFSATVWAFLSDNFSMNNPTWSYIIVYFLLVLWFAYFYISITFNTDEIAETIQKKWWYIPGIRPWEETSIYLRQVSNRLNLFWWGFLALIAVFPYTITKLNDVFQIIDLDWWQRIDFIISWAWLIIVVWVVLELIRRANSEMVAYDYGKFQK